MDEKKEKLFEIIQSISKTAWKFKETYFNVDRGRIISYKKDDIEIKFDTHYQFEYDNGRSYVITIHDKSSGDEFIQISIEYSSWGEIFKTKNYLLYKYFSDIDRYLNAGRKQKELRKELNILNKVKKVIDNSNNSKTL